MKVPRELQVLMINDNRDIAIHPSRERAIHGWVEAQAYWLARGVDPRQSGDGGHGGKTVPDIVLCDIDFSYDKTSPLELVHRKKPTGLLYAIPFVAQARILGRPCVVMFHTGNRDLFTRVHPEGKGGDRIPDVMPLLAAELVGLITAINHQGPESKPIADPTEAWRWLSENNLVNESTLHAKQCAYREYRRQLVDLCSVRNQPGRGLMVRPSNYRDLCAWCTVIAKGREQTAQVSWEAAPGLELVLPDGSLDCLSLRSLFRDVEEPELFRGDLFELPENEDQGEDAARTSWISDQGALVGAFISALGDWAGLFDAAVAAAERLRTVGVPRREGGTAENAMMDETSGSTNLNNVVPNSVDKYALVRLLTLVFQAVYMYHQARTEWSREYLLSGWDEQGGRFDSSLECTLLATLRQMFDQLCENYDDEEDDEERIRMSPADIVTIFGRSGESRIRGKRLSIPRWLEFHLSLLEDMGLVRIEYSGEGRARTITGLYIPRGASFSEQVIPTCPSALRHRFLPAFDRGLADLLGFNTPTNELRRVPHDALFWPVMSGGTDSVPSARKVSSKTKQERDEVGKAFIEDLKDGRLPPWLRRLGQDYARAVLQWEEQEHWPAFIRP